MSLLITPRPDALLREADSDLAVLRIFPELRHLVVLSDRVTDVGLEYLAGMQLHWLALYSRSITVKGVMKLAATLGSLEGVTIRRAKMSDADRAAFHAALPCVKWR